jgi:hypothetical protein
MDTPFLVILITCLLLGIPMSGVFIHIDIEGSSKSRDRIGNDYRWEHVLSILLGAAHIGLSIADVVMAVFECYLRSAEYKWLDVGVVCNVHLLAGVHVRTCAPLSDTAEPWYEKLARLLQHLQHPNWAVRSAYGVTLITVLLV